METETLSGRPAALEETDGNTGTDLENSGAGDRRRRRRGAGAGHGEATSQGVQLHEPGSVLQGHQGPTRENVQLDSKLTHRHPSSRSLVFPGALGGAGFSGEYQRN